MKIKRYFNTSLLKNLLKQNPLYIIIYEVLLIISFTYIKNIIAAYALIVIFFWILIIFLFVASQHNYLNKEEKKKVKVNEPEPSLESIESEEIINEIVPSTDPIEKSEEDTRTERLTTYNSFVLAIYLKMIVPLLISLPITVFLTEYLSSNHIFSNIAIISGLHSLLPDYISNFTVIIILTAIAVFLWANFKTLLRTLIFTIFFYASSCLLIVLLIGGIKRYIIGFYNPLISSFRIMDDAFNRTSNLKYIPLIFIFIVITILLIYLGKKRFIINIDKYPGKILTYTFLILSLLIPAVSILLSNSKFYIAVTALLIITFIIGYLICLSLYCKGFKMRAFLKKFFIAFITVTLIISGIRYDIFGYSNYVPKIENIKQVELRIIDSKSDIHIFDFMRIFVFKSEEALSAITQMQKKLIKMERSFFSQYKKNNSNIMIFNLNYKLNLKDVKKEYYTLYDYNTDPSIILPLIKTEEFKHQYFSIVYKTGEKSLVFVDDLINEKTVFGRSIDKEIVYGLQEALKSDVEKYDMDYILDSNTVYKYTVQLIISNGDNLDMSDSEMYYIPDFYTQTISYIEGHADKIFTEG